MSVLIVTEHLKKLKNKDTKSLSPVLGMALCVSYEETVSGLQPLVPPPPTSVLRFEMLGWDSVNRMPPLPPAPF